MSMSYERRTFLRDCFFTGVGTCGGLILSSISFRSSGNPADATENSGAGGYENRLKDLGIELPPPAKPVAVYVQAVVTGNLLYTSGHIAWTPDGKPVSGRVGQDFTLEQGADAARQVGLSLLTSVRQTIGSLDRIVRLVKVLGMVNCTPDFHQHPKVINGFSELMVQIFGEQAGKAARSAVGMTSLPSNAPVEVEAIFEIRPF